MGASLRCTLKAGRERQPGVECVADVDERATAIAGQIVILIRDVEHVQAQPNLVGDFIVGEQVQSRIAGNFIRILTDLRIIASRGIGLAGEHFALIRHDRADRERREIGDAVAQLGKDAFVGEVAQA